MTVSDPHPEWSGGGRDAVLLDGPHAGHHVTVPTRAGSMNPATLWVHIDDPDRVRPGPHTPDDPDRWLTYGEATDRRPGEPIPYAFNPTANPNYR